MINFQLGQLASEIAALKGTGNQMEKVFIPIILKMLLVQNEIA